MRRSVKTICLCLLSLYTGFKSIFSINSHQIKKLIKRMSTSTTHPSFNNTFIFRSKRIIKDSVTKRPNKNFLSIADHRERRKGLKLGNENVGQVSENHRFCAQDSMTDTNDRFLPHRSNEPIVDINGLTDGNTIETYELLLKTEIFR